MDAHEHLPLDEWVLVQYMVNCTWRKKTVLSVVQDLVLASDGT